MSTYHKDEMCVAVNKVNREETEPVVVCHYDINIVPIRSLLGNNCEISKTTGAVTTNKHVPISTNP
jgi:hypothetical protein